MVEEDRRDTQKVVPLLFEKKVKKGKIASITPSWIILDVNGNGERIAFDMKKHATLKVGDTMDL